MSPFAAFALGPSSAVWIEQGLPLVHELPLPAGEAYQVVAAAADAGDMASAASVARTMNRETRPRLRECHGNRTPARAMSSRPCHGPHWHERYREHHDIG